MAKYVPDQPTVEPLAWRIPEAARRAGMAETKFREDYVRTGKVGYVPYGNDKLIPDFEIERLLRAELQFEGRDKS